MLAVQAASVDVLIDQSLLVGNVQPLLRVACRDDEAVKLRIVRSTLVTGQTLVRARRLRQGRQSAGAGARVGLDPARNDPAGADGDLLRLAGGAAPDTVRWRAVNTVYAGWKKLLASDGMSIDGSDLSAWRLQWRYREGDRALLETWPNYPPAQLDDLPAAVFWAYDPPVGFAAQAGPGPLGATVGRLPPEPVDWLPHTFDRPELKLAGVAPDPGEPAIDTTADGLYHGEAVDLPARADLGLFLDKLLKRKQPMAPRVVFHISGTGDHPSSPLRVQGVTQLVLYFKPEKADPLTLTVNAKGLVLDRAALIETYGGSLELIGANIRYENSKTVVMPPHLVKVAGGNLLLHRCRLQGPLGKASDGFRSLLAMTGPANGPLECRLSDSVLLSGKGVLVSGGAVKLAARQNVALALGDALQPELAGSSEAGPIAWQFEHNTWALRRALIAPKLGHDGAAPILVQAAANYFTDPFGDPAPQSTLLRLPDGVLGRGLLSWQGKGNAFDRRLEGFYGNGKQSLADWLALWGRTGEQDALAVDPGPPVKTPFNVDAPQLERLALPREVRPEPGNAPPGADLGRLGLLKKKG